MNRKTLLFVFLAVFLGIAIGIGGTIGFQKIFVPDTRGGDIAEQSPRTRITKEGPIIEVGEFTVNLQGGAFLRTTIAVEGLDEKSEEILAGKTPFIKDRINTVLSSKSLKDVQPNVREELREELVVQLNEIAGNEIQDVLFVSFVYQ